MGFHIFQDMKEILEIVFWMIRPGFPRMEPQLYRACKDGHRDVLLRTSTPELMNATPERDMPLHICAKANHLGCVQILLQIYGQNFILHRMIMLHYYTNSIGNTPLHEAAKEGHATVVEELVRRYQRLASRVNKYGETPLFLSCVRGHLFCVQTLLSYDHGRSALTLTNDGRLSLHVAAFNGCEDIVNAIANCDEGKKAISMKDGRGATALHWAIEGEQVAVAMNLIARKPNLCYLKDAFGRCPIHIAAIKGHVELIDNIASAKPYCIDMRASDGKTILHYAVANNCVSLIEWIRYGQTYHKFQGDERDLMGNEPLHVAAISSSNNTIFETLLNGFPCANPNNMNQKGLTPLELCHEGEGEISESIKERLKTTFIYENNVRVTASNSKSNESDGVIEISSVIAALIATTAATMQLSDDENEKDKEKPTTKLNYYLLYDLYRSWAFFASMLVLLVWLVLDPLTKKGMRNRPWLNLTMPILGVSIVSLSAAFFLKTCVGLPEAKAKPTYSYELITSPVGVFLCVVSWILFGTWRSYAEMPRKRAFITSLFFLLVRLPIIIILGLGLPVLWWQKVTLYDVKHRIISMVQVVIFVFIPPLILRCGHLRAFLIVMSVNIMCAVVEAISEEFDQYFIAGDSFALTILSTGAFVLTYILSLDVSRGTVAFLMRKSGEAPRN